MDCFDCLSIWVAAPFALFAARRPADRLVSWLALSGAASVLEQITAGRQEILDVSADTGGQHGMLRQEAGGDRADGPAEPPYEPGG
jgi:hypothetical protein